MQAQGSQINAKEDTALLLLDATLTDDLSQFNFDLTASAVGATHGKTGGFRHNSALRSITGSEGRELYVRVDLLPGTDANMVFIVHGDPAGPLATHTYRLDLDANGDVRCMQNNVTLATKQLTLAANLQEVSIVWSTHFNPDTTGASDELISELAVYGHGDDAYDGEMMQFTHALPTSNSTWTIYVGGVGDAITWTSDCRQVRSCRISRMFHNQVEFAEDWLSGRVAHNASYATLDDPIGPIDVGSGMSAPGEWAGQHPVGYIAAHANALRARAVSPLVNEVYHDAVTLRGDLQTPAQWFTSPPGGNSNYHLDVTKLRWVPLPAINYAFVRVHVKSTVAAGAAVPIAIRCYAFNRPHVGMGATIGQHPVPALDFEFVEATLTVDHGVNDPGEWLNFGLLRIPRILETIPGWRLTCHLCLAHSFDPEEVSANDDNARLVINAWHVRPVIGD